MDQVTVIVGVLNRTTSASNPDIRRAEDELVEYSKTRGLFKI